MVLHAGGGQEGFQPRGIGGSGPQVARAIGNGGFLHISSGGHSEGGPVDRQDFVAADLARVVVEQPADGMGFAGHRGEVARGHAEPGEPHFDAKPLAEPVGGREHCLLFHRSGSPSAARIAAVRCGTAGELNASTCGKMRAFAAPCGMWWRVPSG